MSEAEPPPSKSAKGRIVFWLAALGVPLLLLLAWSSGGKPGPRPVLPNPNGYDYFVKAGGVLSGMWTNSSHQTLTDAELQAFLSANQACLELVREGLRHQSRTHLDYDASYIERMMTNLSTFRPCGRLLIAEGWLAEMNGKPSAALDSYFDAMRLGQECGRGGVLMERLVGVAIEHSALAALRHLIPKLDVPMTRKGLGRLLQFDASHDPAGTTFAAEDEWIRQTAAPWQRFMASAHPTLRKNRRDVRDSLTNNLDKLQAARRRVIVEAAARMFELEKGRRPTGYADLVPAYLKTIPLDPATGTEIAHPF